MSKALKRTVSILLSLLMTLSLVAGLSFTSYADIYDPWDGTIPTQSPAGYSVNGTTYSISTPAAFIWFLKSVNDAEPFVNHTVQLTRDIDLGGVSTDAVWSNVDRAFKGTFDGQGYTISNFTCTTTSRNNAALFTKIDGATIRNVNLKNVKVDDVDSTRGQYVGALVGYATGRCIIENVHVTSGFVKGRKYLGGLVGYAASGATIAMRDCSNAAVVANGEDQIGGLLGGSYGAANFNNCYNTGAVSGTTTVGGILGYCNQNVAMTNCYNTGNITATSTATLTSGLATAGGLVGYYRDNTCNITDCCNLGLIRGNGHVGGLLGLNKDTAGTVNISRCFNTGTITSYTQTVSYYSSASYDFKGGLLGFSQSNTCTIADSYNWGSVIGGAMSSGIFGGTGSLDDSGSAGTITINNCYSAGKVHGNWAYTFGWGNGNTVPDTNYYLTGILETPNQRVEGLEISKENLINAGDFISTALVLNIEGVQYGAYDKCYYPIMSWLTSSELDMINDFYQPHSVAHKGYQMVAPANTLPAYNAAGSAGFWGAECDIQRTSDGHWVLCHGNMSEMTDVTGSISSYTLAQLQEIAITKGNYVSQYAGLTFCTLEDYLAACADYDMVPVIEVKDAPSNAQLSELATLLLAQPNADDIVIIAQESSILPYLRSQMPDTEMYYCTGQSSPSIDTIKNLWLDYGIGWDFHYSFVTDTASDGRVREALTYGVPLMTWTTDDSYNSMTQAQRIDATYASGVRYFTSGSSNLEAAPLENTATATMYATVWSAYNYRNTVNYTIHNLTDGTSHSFNNNTPVDQYTSQNVYRKTYQTGENVTCSQGTLEIDRSYYNTVEEMGLNIEYKPHVFSRAGYVRWGVELFPAGDDMPAGLGSLTADAVGVANDYNQRTVVGTEGNSYTYELHFGSPTGQLRTAETCNGNFSQEASIPSEQDLDYGPYTWYITGPAPQAGESVTLRIVAICCSRYNADNLQMLSEWTDVTIVGTCSHAYGFTSAAVSDDHMEYAASCEMPASYYYSCPVCGANGTDTFEYGAATGHDWGDWVEYDEENHAHYCENNGEHFETEPHTFDAWYDGNDGYSYRECLYCGYLESHPNSYTIGFETFDGTWIQAICAEYGTPIVAPDDPTKEGYYFLGWLRNGNVAYVPATMPAENYTLYANWFRLSYTVTYLDAEGNLIREDTVPYDDSINPPAAPEKTDYIFTGWDHEIPEKMPAENLTFTAQYEPLAIVVRRHSLTLDGDIGVNFYVDVPNATADTYATFTVAGQTTTAMINLNQYAMVDGYKLYKFTCNVHAPQTDTPITGKVVRGTMESEVFSYSVQDYLTEAQTALAANPLMMRLAAAIATYGFCANDQLNYNQDFVKHDLYDDGDFDTITASSLASYAPDMQNTADGVNYYGSSLLLLTETSIMHYFSLSSGQSIEDFTFLLGEGANAVELTPVINGAYYCVEVRNIASGRLGNPYKVTVLDGDGNIVNCWNFSAMSYSYNVLTKYEANDPAVSVNLANLAKALVDYYRAADAYFSQPH
ncbi:MAG: InlB B-repeat-containing protein [Clostridia bacterium]|nr:InlB B-repeat-containing protein [Clostridia bacterium]